MISYYYCMNTVECSQELQSSQRRMHQLEVELQSSQRSVHQLELQLQSSQKSMHNLEQETQKFCQSHPQQQVRVKLRVYNYFCVAIMSS